MSEAQPWTLPHMIDIVRGWFDAAMYAREYRDVTGSPEQLLVHFCERGWKEGRNPSPDFDSLAYLRAHADVLQHGLNPIYHYAFVGQGEARLTSPAALPSRASSMMLGRDPGDWVALLAPHVDRAFYAATLGEAADGSFDLVAHYAYRGWLDGLDPNPAFSTRDALAANPDLLRKQLNPLVHALAMAAPPEPVAAPDPVAAPAQAAAPPTAAPDPVPIEDPNPVPAILSGWNARLGDLPQHLAEERERSRPDPAQYANPADLAVAPEFDATFYRTLNADVVAAQMDLLTHYNRHGWQDGRDPAPWFDTSHYLAANPDVAASGGNPFLHYILDGRREGRSASPSDWRRAVVDTAEEPSADQQPPGPGGMSAKVLTRRLRKACEGGDGLVLSIGQAGPSPPGEQAAYAARGVTALHVAPLHPAGRLTRPDAPMSLSLDGEPAGVASYATVQKALRDAGPQGSLRAFVVHGVLGHDAGQLIGLQQALGSDRNVFWLHDYASLCPGYHLLRNDVAFCAAPPVDSVACRICVYGGLRPGHLADMARLFAAVPFAVVAPSQTALDIWGAGSNLPRVDARVHAPGALEPTGAPAASAQESLRGTVSDPVRVAFLGPATPSAGWPLWLDLLKRAAGLGAYHFMHLGGGEGSLPGFERVTLSPADHGALGQALKEQAVDLALVLSPWPDPDGTAACEALAAGAEIVCLRGGGAAADLARQHRRGFVAPDEAALCAFFEDLSAVDYVRRCRAEPAPPLRLVQTGYAAALDGPAP